MTKTIDTLVEDIYEVIEGHGGWEPAITKFLSDNISEVAETRFSKPQEPRTALGLSSLGTPCQRKLWYSLNRPDLGEKFTAETLGTFFYGDLLEVVVIAFAMAAGHRVEGMQDRLDVYGVKGHRDVVIDGVTVDVKSASKYSFEKFKAGSIRHDDPFGYISQLGSYVAGGKDDPIVVDKTRGAFLVVQKDRFKLCLDMHDFTEDLKYKEQEVKQVTAMLEGPIPIRGVSDVPDGKSGNMKLDVACSYCAYKNECWPKLRTFLYSTGPRFLTNVALLPKVHEVTNE